MVSETGREISVGVLMKEQKTWRLFQRDQLATLC